MPGVTVDGGDPEVVYATVGEAVDRARAGDGPTLVESKVYRLSAHGNIIVPPGIPLHFPEHEAIEVFGNAAEYEAAKKGDPVPRYRAKLVQDGVLSAEQADEIMQSAKDEMQAAVDFGIESELPAPEDATKFVYA
jgi:pyruvate dehydrogenase E1 component alpha subunit